jgi:hypothetical protein
VEADGTSTAGALEGFEHGDPAATRATEHAHGDKLTWAVVGAGSRPGDPRRGLLRPYRHNDLQEATMGYRSAPEGWWKEFVGALPARTGKVAVVRADGSPHVAPV